MATITSGGSKELWNPVDGAGRVTGLVARGSHAQAVAEQAKSLFLAAGSISINQSGYQKLSEARAKIAAVAGPRTIKIVPPIASSRPTQMNGTHASESMISPTAMSEANRSTSPVACRVLPDRSAATARIPRKPVSQPAPAMGFSSVEKIATRERNP